MTSFLRLSFELRLLMDPALKLSRPPPPCLPTHPQHPQVGASSVHFSTDSTHVSRLPRRLRDTDEQLSIFAEQLGPYCPAAAAACLAARSDALDVGGAAVAHGSGAVGGGSGGRSLGAAGGGAVAEAAEGGGRYAVDLTVRYIYKLPEPRLLTGGSESNTPLSEVRCCIGDFFPEGDCWEDEQRVGRLDILNSSSLHNSPQQQQTSSSPSAVYNPHTSPRKAMILLPGIGTGTAPGRLGRERGIP